MHAIKIDHMVNFVDSKENPVRLTAAQMPSPDAGSELSAAQACAAVTRRRGPSLDKTAQTQRQITEATLAIFLEQGIARTTMAQIAARAGVAKGTIYSYYPSKQALLRGVVLQALSQSTVYQPMCRNPQETVQAWLRRSLLPGMERIERSERGELARLILSEAKQHPELAQLYRELAFAPWLQHVQTMLELACAEGELPPGTAAESAYLLASPFWLGMVHNGLLTDNPQQHMEIAPLIERMIAVLFAQAAANIPANSLPTNNTPLPHCA